MHESLSITDEVYARMSSDHVNNILLSFNFDDDYSHEKKNMSDEKECFSNPDTMNKMLMEVFSSIDPDMLIQTGQIMKMMKKIHKIKVFWKFEKNISEATREKTNEKDS